MGGTLIAVLALGPDEGIPLVALNTPDEGIPLLPLRLESLPALRQADWHWWWRAGNRYGVRHWQEWRLGLGWCGVGGGAGSARAPSDRVKRRTRHGPKPRPGFKLGHVPGARCSCRRLGFAADTCIPTAEMVYPSHHITT